MMLSATDHGHPRTDFMAAQRESHCCAMLNRTSLPSNDVNWHVFLSLLRWDKHISFLFVIRKHCSGTCRLNCQRSRDTSYRRIGAERRAQLWVESWKVSKLKQVWTQLSRFKLICLSKNLLKIPNVFKSTSELFWQSTHPFILIS